MPPVTPDEFLRIGMGFWASKTLLSAVELGVSRRGGSTGARAQLLGPVTRLDPHLRQSR